MLSSAKVERKILGGYQPKPVETDQVPTVGDDCHGLSIIKGKSSAQKEWENGPLTWEDEQPYVGHA